MFRKFNSKVSGFSLAKIETSELYLKTKLKFKVVNYCHEDLHCLFFLFTLYLPDGNEFSSLQS